MIDKPVKLMHLSFVNGGAITLNPFAIMFAMPHPQNLMQTNIGYGGPIQATIAMPHPAFVRKWQAALDNKEFLDQDK